MYAPYIRFKDFFKLIVLSLPDYLLTILFTSYQ